MNKLKQYMNMDFPVVGWGICYCERFELQKPVGNTKDVLVLFES